MECAPEEKEKLGAILGFGQPVAGGGRHSIICGKWLYSYWERCVAELGWAALGTARWRQGCPSLPVIALPAACDAVRFLLSSAIVASFGARQQGERWLFGVHLIRTVRYIPALATQTDIHHPTDPFLYPAVGRTLVILLLPYSARHDKQCRVHKIVIEPNDKKRLFFFPLPKNRDMLVQCFGPSLYVTSVYYAFPVYSNSATCRTKIGC